MLELIADGTIDCDLAALLWLLVERAVPVLVVASPPMAGKTTLLTAVLDFVPPGMSLDLVTGIDPGAFNPDDGHDALGTARYFLAPELSDHAPVYVWGAAARRLVQAAGRGAGLATTMHGDRLEDVFDQLQAPPVSLSDDELSNLGVVLVLGVFRGSKGWHRRIVAAHYVRPVARDAGGHVRRRPPAVLVTWDPRDDTFSHFEWGIADEMAGRVGLRPGDFEGERARRADFLRACVERGLTGLDASREAIAGYRSSGASRERPA